MRLGKRHTASMFLLFSLLLASTANAQNAKTFWKDFVKGCAGNDLIGGKVLYMGPDNADGPGTVFRKVGNDWHPGPAFDKSAAPDDIRSAVLRKNKDAGCTGSNTKKTAAGFSLILSKLTAPITGNASVDLNKARTMVVSVNSWAWDSLLDPTFAQKLQSYSKEYREAALQNYVIGRALRISGFSAELDFDNSLKAGLETKYKGGVDLGGGLKGEWTSTGKMKVSAPGDSIYIAAQMYKVSEAGFKGKTGVTYLLPAPTAPTSRIVAK